jgi:hypothetical protein
MRHPSTRTLARYSAGAFGVRKVARVTAHLAGCARCSGTSTDLTTVSDLLAKMAPTAMPAFIADRLARAIASESASRTAHLSAEAGATPVGVADATTWLEPGEPDRAVPGRPELPARRRRTASPRRRSVMSSPVVLRGLAAAAAVVIVAGAGYLFTNRASTTPAARTAAPTAHAPKTYQGALGASNHRGIVRVPYRLGAGARSQQSSSAAPQAAPVLTSNADYTKANLAVQVRRSVASAADEYFGTNATTVPAPVASGASASGELTLLDGLTVKGLTGCLSGVADGRQVLVADVARYLGKPATIIVFRSLTSMNLLDVVIVGLACSATDAHTIARTTVPLG